MKIGESLKIGAAHVIVSKQEIVKSVDNKEDILGLSKPSVGKIEIATTYHGEPCPEDVQADSYIHEILHNISADFGLGLTEKQVTGLSAGLLMVIRDNDLDFRVDK